MKQLFALWAFTTLLATELQAQCTTSNEKILFSPNVSFSLPETGFTTNGTLIAGGTASPQQAAIATFIDNNSVIGGLNTYTDLSLKKLAVAPNNDIIATGWSYSEQSVITLLVMRVTPTGDIVWVKRLQDTFSPDAWTLHRVEPESIVATSDGGVVICGAKEYQQPNNGNNYKYRSFVIKLDQNGNVAWTREDTNNSHDEHRAVVEKNGSIYIAGTTDRTQDALKYGTLMNLNLQTGALISFRGYHLQNIRSNTFRDLHATSYGFLVGAQAYTTNGFKHGYYVLKLDHNGNILAQKQLNFSGSSMLNPFYEVMPTPDGGCLVWMNDKMRTLSTQEAKLYKLDQNLAVEWKRHYTPPPGKTGTVIYKAWAEAGAFKALGMSPDPDATHNILYSRLFYINSTGLLSGCTTVSDHLDIKDSLTYARKDISWTNTYAMSFTGPTTKVITKSTPGTTKKLICSTSSCHMQDVTITGDTVLCGVSQTTLKATRIGDCAKDYTWEADPDFADIISINDSTIQLHVKKEATGTVTIQWRGACTTIEKKIQVTAVSQQPPMPDLGRDTSICSGDTLTLTLPTPYNHVLWSDNSTGPQLKADKAGTYWVKVSNDNTCFAADTLVIQQVHVAPAISLRKDAALCLPDPLVLQPGGTGLTYLWQDGSTHATYTVTQPGTYWVRATNTAGCISTDTLQIAASHQKPSGFVTFTDSLACIGERIQLLLNQDFQLYNWNNGASTAKTYWVNRPGVYAITVTDGNGCTATENILIRDKGCTKAIYFPTAFNPQGVNKTFRPLVQGVIPERLHFAIYNRWGELVFESTQANSGWNGTYKGKRQDTGTFVWVCRYQFPGEAEQLVKGTVLLIQ